MGVNTWTKAATAALADARISQAAVAEQGLRISRAAFSPYLNGSRKPSPQKVLKINKAIGEATNEAAVTPYLDCEAVEAGLLSLGYMNTGALIDGAFFALEELGIGLLNANWRPLLDAKVESWSDARVAKLLIALNRDHRKLLREHATVPWKKGHDTVAAVLRRFSLGELIGRKGPTRGRLDRFRDIVRGELDSALDPNLTARERRGIEDRLFIAALGLVREDTRTLLAEHLDGWMPPDAPTPKGKK